MGYSGDEDILELVGSNHGVVVKDGGGGDVSVEDIIGDVVEGLFSCFVLVHVEGIVDLCCEYSLAPGFYGVDWGLKIFDFGFSQHSFVTDLVVSQAFAYSG